MGWEILRDKRFNQLKVFHFTYGDRYYFIGRKKLVFIKRENIDIERLERVDDEIVIIFNTTINRNKLTYYVPSSLEGQAVQNIFIDIFKIEFGGNNIDITEKEIIRNDTGAIVSMEAIEKSFRDVQ